jgi:hypothetical protein
MAGMWELPEVAGAGASEQQIPPSRFATRRNDKVQGSGRRPLFTLRHSITVTDYTVRVWQNVEPGGIDGKWISRERLGGMALTGLARKILRKAEML